MATTKIETLEDAFILKLREAYSAEKLLLKTLPRLAKTASHATLAQVFEDHAAETEMHVDRLEQIFESLDQKPSAKKHPAISGLLEAGKDSMAFKGRHELRDALLLGDAQAVEHYEIALYDTLIEWGRSLGHEDIADLLEETYEEERVASELLDDIAVHDVNDRAAIMEDYENEDEEEEA